MTDGKEKTAEVTAKLRNAGLRPTRQRVDLASLLFAEGNRHVTAESLQVEALRNEISVSLATIYNTLNMFSDCGLLRAIAIEGSKTYYDTNTSNHQHFYFDHDGQLTDIEHPVLVSTPPVPEGTRIERIDVLIRLSKKEASAANNASVSEEG